MSSLIKSNQFIEENISISSNNQLSQDNTNNKNQKKIPIIRKYNNTDIIIDLSQKNEGKIEDDDRSGQVLNEEKKIKAKTERPKPLTQYEKNYLKFTEIMQERTMRLELEKANQESERLKKEYEERNSYKYLFDNDRQFQKMLKSIQIKLIIIFFISLFSFILNSIVYFKLTKQKVGLALANMVLSIGGITLYFVLTISLQMGLLKDPNLSKAFRLFNIFEFILQIVSFVFNIIIPFLMYEYLYKLSTFKTIVIYFLFFLIFLSTIFAFKFCYFLFIESLLILLNKKTEYARLMINEQFPGVDYSFNINKKKLNSKSNNENTSTLSLTQTDSNFISGNEKKIKNHKDDEKYRNYHYFNNFHMSVTSDRKTPQYFK